MRVHIALDDAKLRAWAKQNPEAVRRGMHKFLLQAGQLATREMRLVMKQRFGRIGVRNPGRGPPTGATGASVRATRGTGFVDIGPSTPYAPFVDTGTRPHIIKPRRARFLRFVPAGGGVAFAKKVNHPGFAGHFYIRRTAERVRPKLAPLAQRCIRQEMRS